MPAPPFFDENNYWKAKGAQLRASGGGVIGASLDSFRTAYVTLAGSPKTTGQWCGAGAVDGEPTDPDDANLGKEYPLLQIAGGVFQPSAPADSLFWQDKGQDQWGLFGSEVRATMTPSHGNEGVVNFVQTGSDIVSSEMPPYPDAMEYVRLSVQFRHQMWSDHRPVWVGAWYVELYELTPEMLQGTPGYGNETADVPCPPRPPWPYTVPVQSVSIPRAARIRRSRP